VVYDGVIHWLAVHAQAIIEPYFVTVRRVPLGVPVAIAILALACMPLSMLVLRATFRRARLRTAHLFRGWVWCTTGFTLLSIVLVALAFGVSRLESNGILGFDEAVIYFTYIAAVPPLWIWAWWFGFAKWYLRIPHAFFVSVLLWIIAMLLTLALSIGVFPVIARAMGVIA
jgi:hypothetical protein